MNKFEIFPYLNVNGAWTVPDEVMGAIWHRLVQEDKVKPLFYDGNIKSEFDFIEFMRQPRNFPVLVIEKESRGVVHVAWINDLSEIGAWAHHVSIGRYRRGAWEAVKAHWQKYFTNLKLLLGMSPETNEKAVKFLKKICGFTIVGKVPLMCRLAYEDDRRVAGIVSYYEL